MSDYIIQKALSNVWCTPIQDSQVRIRMTVATPDQGVRGRFVTSLYQFELPDTSSRWHIYKLGRIYIRRFGITLKQLMWYPLHVIGNRSNVLTELYNDDGRIYPRADAFILETDRDGIYIAIRHSPASHEMFKPEPLTLRLYNNAYFGSARSIGNPRQMQVTVPPNTTQVQYAQAIALFTALKQQPGYVYALINGIMFTTVNSITLKQGDYVEFVYDSSVKKAVLVPISTLNTFTSTRDNNTKYLVHSQQLASDTIEYHDDVDVFLVRSQSSGHRGVMYPKNEVTSMRNLTHCDYSIPADKLVNLASTNDFLGSIDSCFLLLLVRHSGYYRPLEFEAQHILELKKLPYDKNVEAMHGIDSNVDVWVADNLERSPYNRVMNSPYGEISKDMATRMYGYHGMAQTLSSTPQDVPTTGARIVVLPEGLSKLSTIYEFTANGTLIDFYQHSNATNYIVRNANCVFIEGIMGLGTDSLQQNVDILSSDYNPNVHTRFYYCTKISGVPTDNFVEVEEGDKLNLGATNYTWLISPTANRLLVRREDRFLAYSQNVTVQNGTLKFRIQSREVLGGISFLSDVAIPTLKLDLWVNKRKLIEDIDYVVRWPEVYVTNRKFVNATGNNIVTVRAYGLSNTEEMRDVPTEKGYVSFGTLSRNQKYDIHDGRLLHICVDGYVKRRSDIRIEESSDMLVVNDVFNGTPYLLAEIMPVLGDYSSIKTMDLRELSRSDEEQIETYLTHKIPETPTDQTSVKASRWQLVSPYISRILSEMQDGSIPASFVNASPSTQEIVQELTEYEEILHFDPTQDFNSFDENNIQILAHYSATPIPVTFQQYQLLDKVNKHFLFGRVDLSRSYTIA